MKTSLLLLICLQNYVHGFLTSPLYYSFHKISSFSSSPPSVINMSASAGGENVVNLEVKVPPSTSGLLAQMKVKKLLADSEIVEIRYKLPFGLDVEPQKGRVVCTNDGAGGEKVGDILRYTSCWKMGLPRGDGLVTTAASFAGGLSWQCSLFDVGTAKSWQEVVEALTSNVDSRTDEVVLLFEREKTSEE